MTTVFRKMEERDREEVLSMMEIFYASDAVIGEYDRSVFERDFSDSIGDCPYVEGYVFETGGKISGYSMEAMSYSTEEGGLCLWIEDLYVKPGYRRMGIASGFFGFIEEQYKGRVSRIRLEVEEENETARALYSSAGYGILPYEQRKKSI